VSWIDVVQNWDWQDCKGVGHMSSISRCGSTCSE
jgi:hypothetical protein